MFLPFERNIELVYGEFTIKSLTRTLKMGAILRHINDTLIKNFWEKRNINS